MSDIDTIPPGTVVGGCRIVDCIGGGGMGQVYRAEHLRLSRTIALKILPEDVIRRNPAGIERFFQEARTLAKIEHPNVLTIHDCGQDGAYHYLQTRYVEGHNLEELVEDRPKGLPAEQVRKILLGALDGLAAVHHAGMVHRDVKPANFMLDATGKVILMDFGLAKFLAADNEARTEPGYVLGTPQYMSPEQCNGLELDPRSDLYSLGCVAYFLLTGHRPFDGDNPLQIMKMHRDEFAPPIRSYRPDVPEELAHAIAIMMEKNPDGRYSDAAACIAELRRIEAVVEGDLPGARGQVRNLPTHPPTSYQPAGMPPTAGPLPAQPAAAAGVGPRGGTSPRGGPPQGSAPRYAAGPAQSPSPPSPPAPPVPPVPPAPLRAPMPPMPPVPPATLAPIGPPTLQDTAMLEVESMATIYRSELRPQAEPLRPPSIPPQAGETTLPPAGLADPAFDPMGATMLGATLVGRPGLAAPGEA
ncbi:MAG: serine/threonine protein kinase, partial [Planctomycetota bacterium]